MAASAVALARQTLVVVLAASSLCPTAHAQDIPPPAYQLAAQRAGIPAAVLYAVALQESGLRRAGHTIPWPWSLNVAGASRRYASQANACAGLLEAIRQTSSTRIDVGLGQINLGYQRHRYKQPCDLLDPYANLAVAAEILREHYQPGEDWLLAIGRYHRPAGGAPAARYRHSVALHLERVQGVTSSTAAVHQEIQP